MIKIQTTKTLELLSEFFQMIQFCGLYVNLIFKLFITVVITNNRELHTEWQEKCCYNVKYVNNNTFDQG